VIVKHIIHYILTFLCAHFILFVKELHYREKQEGIPIKEVCYKVGMDDPYYFWQS
jgi:hypothetical protein